MRLNYFETRLDRFYFKRFENSFIYVGKSTSIPLIFKHLNWNVSKFNPSKIKKKKSEHFGPEIRMKVFLQNKIQVVKRQFTEWNNEAGVWIRPIWMSIRLKICLTHINESQNWASYAAKAEKGPLVYPGRILDGWMHKWQKKTHKNDITFPFECANGKLWRTQRKTQKNRMQQKLPKAFK